MVHSTTFSFFTLFLAILHYVMCGFLSSFTWHNGHEKSRIFRRGMCCCCCWCVTIWFFNFGNFGRKEEGEDENEDENEEERTENENQNENEKVCELEMIETV